MIDNKISLMKLAISPIFFVNGKIYLIFKFDFYLAKARNNLIDQQLCI